MELAIENQPSTYDLPLASAEAGLPAPYAVGRSTSLPGPLLFRNVFWFCRLRWFVVAALAAFEGVNFLPAAVRWLGIQPQRVWPAAVAAVLAAANLAFLRQAHRRERAVSAGDAERSLWGQIILDLAVLTFVVHHLGSLETYGPFTYLFHIVLACIFFTRLQSLLVTLLASVLYAGCVAMEAAGWYGGGGIYAVRSLREAVNATPGAALSYVLSAVSIWLGVWYLASHLSNMVRDRDRHLAQANRRLEETQKEKTRHMLHTTHQLKAPLAAIHANLQLLLKGYVGTLPDEAIAVVERISSRARRLVSDIQKMLQLANLQSVERESLAWSEVDLATILRECMEPLRATATETHVTIEEDLQPARVWAVEDHMRMLATNLLANAVAYSRPGGTVRAACGQTPEGGAWAVVEDHGIGIDPEKLPRIFDEYYRTNEAAQHNKDSTGLGLAIVKQVVQAHGIRVRVTSALGSGTKVELRFRGNRGNGRL